MTNDLMSTASSKVRKRSGRKRDRQRWYLDTTEEEEEESRHMPRDEHERKRQPEAAASNTSSIKDNDKDKLDSRTSSSFGQETHHRKRKKKSSTTTNNKEITKPSKQQSSLPPLAGKLVAVTSLQSHNPKDEEDKNDRNSDDDNNNNNLTYAQLVDKCRHEAGADTTSQVHKRVYCLVATQCAITGDTQRVRKARKLNIPVVSVAWLQDCIQKGKCLEFDNSDRSYLVPPPKDIQKQETAVKVAPKGADDKERAASVPSNDNDEKGTADDQDDDAAGWSEQVDLGCCCVCHENAPAGTKTDCAWCVECSVNLIACKKS